MYIWLFPKIVGKIPPNHPWINRVFHYFHPPFWGIPIFGNTHIYTVYQWCQPSRWAPDTGIDSTTLGFLKPPTCLMRMSRNSSPQLNHQKKTIEQWKQTWLFRVGDDGKGKRDYNKPLGFFSCLNWQVLVLLADMANRRSVKFLDPLHPPIFWYLWHLFWAVFFS